MTPSELFLSTDELEQNGFTVQAVSDFIRNYTRGKASPNPSSLSAAEQAQMGFAASFPSAIFTHSLSCLPEAQV